MIQGTKQDLLDYIRKATELYLKTHELAVGTEEIANKFHLSRSVISKYLNSLFDSKKLIKISTRPVIYFDVQTIEKYCDISKNGYEYLSLEEFEKTIKLNHNIVFFEGIIGKNSSLKNHMNIIQKALNVKMKGLILITGEKGTGKSVIANAFITAYANQYKVSKAKVICTKGYKKYSTDLFGENGELSRIGGIVLIDDIDNMPLEIQDEMSFRLKNEVGGLSTAVITATDIEKVSESLKDIARYKIHIPELSKRTLKEKEKFVCMALEKYDSQDHPVLISNDALNLLCNLDIKENIVGLIEVIDDAYIRAKNDSVSAAVEIYRYHFPLISNINTLLSSSKNKVMLSPEDIREIASNNLAIITIDSIKEQYNKTINTEHNNDLFIQFLVNKINSYCDYILFNKKTNGERLNVIEQVIKNIFSVIEKDYLMSVNWSVVKSLSKTLYESTYIDTHIRNWEIINQSFISEFNRYIGVNYGLVSEQLNQIENQLESMIEVKLDILSRIYLFTALREMNSSVEQYDISGLIVAHGYSTASSIADTANRIIGAHVFDGVDMPIDVSTEDIVNRIKEYIRLRKISKEILLLVDMGSLEQIGQEIADTTSNRVAIINNISTKIAIVLGIDIVQSKRLNDIAENAYKISQINCHIIENRIKKNAIVFSFESGIQTTERVMQVFQASIPNSVDIKYLALDYLDLLDNDRFEGMCGVYNVLFIVGTINTKLNNIPCIALEDIMTSYNMDKFNSLMRNEVSEEEIEIINDNLIRNFSLENILSNVTILNPYILMDLIEEALNNLQRELNVKFTNKVMTGLYLHISSMIERIVTKEYEISHSNIEQFKKEHSIFIESLKRSFFKIEAKYNIEISISEIAYLYDYVSNGFIYNKG